MSSSTRPPCEQRTWILFSGKCEKKSAGNQLQTVPDWGTGILVLSVAAYTCASEPGPQTEKFPKGRSLPPTCPAHPTNVVAGRVPSRFAAPRLSNGRQHLPHSRLFLVPWLPLVLINSFPAIRRQSLLSTLVYYRMTRNRNTTPWTPPRFTPSPTQALSITICFASTRFRSNPVH